MQALCVLGDGAVDVVDALAPRLDGDVATVVAADDAVGDGGRVRSEKAERVGSVRYDLRDDGWTAAGDAPRSLTDVLDELAPRYDHALVAGDSRRRVPTVVLDDRDPERVAGDVLLSVDGADDVDPDELAAAVADAEPWVTLPELVDRATDAPAEDRSGAIATFTGRVRAKDAPDDEPTTHLEFEKYEGVAADRMDAIARELGDRDGVFEVLMHHRVGRVDAGEDIVFVVVLAGHRDAAFRTVKDGIDRLKDEVPIFKKETTVDEEFWLHER